MGCITVTVVLQNSTRLTGVYMGLASTVPYRQAVTGWFVWGGRAAAGCVGMCETVPGTREVATFPAETLGTHKCVWACGLE
jgi:hypothetical protein